MRRVVIVATAILVTIAVWRVSVSASQPSPAVSLYDPNPSHLWNRVYAALLVRQDGNGTSYGMNSLDAPLPSASRHLLERKSHQNAIRVLDEFLQSHAENLIRDPLKRAIFTRDLWAVFDWSAAREPLNRGDPTYDAERRDLQLRLAEILHRIALTSQEIESLPDNYAQAIASEEFPKEYDPAHPERAFLPRDLFDQHGPWAWIRGSETLPAAQHVSFTSGRSRFLVFIRLPGGRKATYDYLRELWEFPQPWVRRGDAPDQADVNPLLPSFPAGTEVALVRQMMLFDDHANLVPAPITESVQIRVYRTVTPTRTETVGDIRTAMDASGQQFFELRLDRSLLFAGRAGGLRAIGPDEKELFAFNAMPFDQLDNPKTRIDWTRAPAITQECVWCHSQAGLKSLNTLSSLLKPNPLQHDNAYQLPPRWWGQDGTDFWKKDRQNWGLLNGYWQQTSVR